jgi:signal transduction histidine kinase
MEQNTLFQSKGSILVWMPKGDRTPDFQGILSEQELEMEICRSAAEIREKLSDRIEAVLIHSDLLSKKAVIQISDALKEQPEWSDIPILIPVAGGTDSPHAEGLMKGLGHVLILDDPFKPAAFKCALKYATRSRENQRRFRDLSIQYEEARKALQESRNQLEMEVQHRITQLDERASQLRRLTGELMSSEQNERHRLVRILHNHLQQLLASAKYRVASLLRSKEPGVTASAQDIEELLGEVIEASRSLTAELSPPIVHESGLRTGMEWLAAFMDSHNGLSVQLKIDKEVDRIDDNTKMLLFESVRELLLNVVKHAQVKSANVDIHENERGMIEIAVSDPGIGFDPSSIEHSGFGLLRIREQLTAIGGRFEITSSPEKGSLFRMIVPLQGAPAAPRFIPNPAPVRPQIESSMPRAEKPLNSTIRVLIADDHAVMRQGLFTALSQEPDIVIVGEAADGKMALERTRSLHPDVVLMDLGMPVMNGIEAAQRIHEEMPKVRIIGLSMYEEKERANAMFESGAVAYLSKSCSVDTLTSTIRQCIG